MSRSLHRRHNAVTTRPLIAFLLVASFGILFVGCGGPSSTRDEPLEEEFTFTEQDLARFRELARQAQDEVEQQTGSGLFVPRIAEGSGASVPTATAGVPPVLDLSKVQTYNTLRQGGQQGDQGKNTYRVTNVFLNVRKEPRVTAGTVGRLSKGDTVELLDFVDAAWAKVRLSDGTEGFVSTRYIAKLVAEDRLQEEKKAFDGMYFVDFGFLNVRKSPDTQAEKLGELPGQAIVRPLDVGEVWARIPFNGGEGYVAAEYLAPFLPNFLVRQEVYQLPVLHYRFNQAGLTDALARHVARLKEAGYRPMTFRQFKDLILAQEERDVRVDPKSVLLAFSDVTPQNLPDIADVLAASGVPGTFFLSTRSVGMDGITAKQIVTLIANGSDVQSGAHAGDDLRSMTNAQVELELKQSRKILEDITGRDVFAIAYPWGGVNDRVLQFAADAGYLFGVGASPKPRFTRAEFLQMPSYLVSASMTEDDVLALLVQQ